MSKDEQFLFAVPAGVDAYLPWLAEASPRAMFLGMISAMVYRRDHYTGKADPSAH